MNNKQNNSNFYKKKYQKTFIHNLLHDGMTYLVSLSPIVKISAQQVIFHGMFVVVQQM